MAVLVIFMLDEEIDDELVMGITEQIEKYGHPNQKMADSDSGQSKRYQLPNTNSDHAIFYDLLYIGTEMNASQNRILERLCSTIATKYSSYNGFVIVKDEEQIETMMNDLCFAVERNAKPILFIPFTGEMTDIAVAIHCDMVAGINIAGTCIFGEVAYLTNGILYRASRLRRSMHGGLMSPNYRELGRFSNGSFIPIPANWICSSAGGEFRYFTGFNRDILCITMTPNLSPEFFKLMGESDARLVVVESYGIGNVPKKNESFLEFVRNCISEDKLIFSYSQCDRGNVDRFYETSFLDLGIHSCFDMTPPAILSKLAYLAGKYKKNDKVLQYMELDIRGELTQTNLKKNLPEFVNESFTST